jgi:hypothetical protein
MLAVLVQLIIYPTLRHIDEDQFASYHSWYTGRITWVVGPLMILQVIGHAYLVVEQPFLLQGIAAFLVLLTWLITGVRAVPLHAKLSRDGQEAAELDQLLGANFLRMLCWVTILPLWIWF